MAISNEIRYIIALKQIPLIGDILARRLIEAFGSAERIFSLSVKEMLQISGIGKITADHIFSNRDAALAISDKELEYIDKYKIRCMSVFDDDYPYRLKQCPDAPLFIFVKGSVLPEAEHVIAIVGTRKSTEYGRKITEDLVKNLQLPNSLIISGLAYGIDTAAHTASLTANIPTIGVLGHGLSDLYPPENKGIARKMVENGALLTEFLSFQKVERENFPIRNRIIAGLADAVIVVEAKNRGGALITAEIANSYNRDVFSIPGRATDVNSKGCNWLIRTNRANLIETAEHLKSQMGWLSKSKKEPIQTKLNIILNPETQNIFDFLSKEGECDIDVLCRKLNLTINSVAMILLDLEFQGLIKSLPGKRYKIA